VWSASDRRSRLRWVGGLIGAIGVSGLPTHTVFAMSSRRLEPGFSDTMQPAFTVVFLMLVLAAFILAALADRGRFRLYSTLTLVLLMAFGLAASIAFHEIEENATAWAGRSERIDAYA
jgi:hypothetical protein